MRLHARAVLGERIMGGSYLSAEADSYCTDYVYLRLSAEAGPTCDLDAHHDVTKRLIDRTSHPTPCRCPHPTTHECTTHDLHLRHSGCGSGHQIPRCHTSCRGNHARHGLACFREHTTTTTTMRDGCMQSTGRAQRCASHTGVNAIVHKDRAPFTYGLAFRGFIQS